MQLANTKKTIDKDWYIQLLEFNKRQNVTTAAFVRVNETFKDFHFQMHGSRPEFQEPSWNVSNVVRSILPGSMVGRVVLGSALVTIANVTYEVFRESVQPFNFSFEADNSISFITPTWQDNLTENGYALVEIRASAGPRTVLSNSLFYTESCPSIGWVGSGLSCRLCPEGTAYDC